MSKSNEKKALQLGMPIGTAANRLRKNVLFILTKVAGVNNCFQCGKEIEKVEELSIEHKVPWLDSDDPIVLYFDLDNIAFSHLNCNVGAGRNYNKSNPGPVPEHGTISRYKTKKYSCRCSLCTEAIKYYMRDYRSLRKGEQVDTPAS